MVRSMRGVQSALRRRRSVPEGRDAMIRAVRDRASGAAAILYGFEDDR
jgi:hypothetical protein